MLCKHKATTREFFLNHGDFVLKTKPVYPEKQEKKIKIHCISVEFPYNIVGHWAWGNQGNWRKPQSRQSSSALGRQTLEDCCTFSMRSWVGVWLWEATEPSPAGGGQGAVRSLWASLRPEITGSQPSASQMPLDTAEELRRKLGPQGRLGHPQDLKGGEDRERGSAGKFPYRRKSLVRSMAGVSMGG
jgi:hypothetical protein